MIVCLKVKVDVAITIRLFFCNRFLLLHSVINLSEMSKSLRPETKAIRSTMMIDANARAVSSPITLSTNFEREPDGSYQYEYIYSRLDNPNRKLLEKSLCELEYGKAAIAFSSGMAATSAIFQLLQPGDHVLLPNDAYYSTKNLMVELFGKWGITMSPVNMSDVQDIKNALTNATKMIWLETPSNPQLSISDIRAISRMAHEVGAICAVDNTWSTPVSQNPLISGADIVMHSTTKYLGGHGDVLGGAVVLKDTGLEQALRKTQQVSGAVPSPFDCWLITRGIKTLHVRFKAQMQSAEQLAHYLAGHEQIEQVQYPGLSSHVQHELASNQMNGYGAMISVQVKGDWKTALAITGKLQLFTTATSLGGVESLVEHRKSIEGEESSTPDNLLRVSVGLEHVEDLKADWDQALQV